MLDTVHRIETPEGVDLTLHVAGPVPRLIAFGVDLALRGVLFAVAAIAVGALGEAGAGLLLVILFGLEWLYPVAFELLDDGRTPGKRALGLRVVRTDGAGVDAASSVLRNVLRAADFLPFGYVVGLVSMACSGRFARLGDLAAGTIVIHDGRGRPHFRGRDGPQSAQVTPRPPPADLDLDEQRAVLAFGQRWRTLSEPRAAEHANLLGPSLDARGVAPEQRVDHLRGMAAWIAGRRPGGPGT